MFGSRGLIFLDDEFDVTSVVASMFGSGGAVRGEEG